ncbi:TPA: 50S ribosomal protein L23 [Candidatus Micrarchaeota archaeon]|nr:MAG: 50S ribosomal protein L23 [Candidatus Micrarchaeota archaeon CG1_02_51_15]HII38893.1 50S ribosomal protein L23 [Candidatus Micrarchaeota archaeon]
MTVLLYPLTTEKAVGGIDRENKLTFIVVSNATKTQVRAEVESQFKEKVLRVTVLNALNGRKKAFVRFKRLGAAADVASKLKIV